MNSKEENLKTFVPFRSKNSASVDLSESMLHLLILLLLLLLEFLRRVALQRSTLNRNYILNDSITYISGKIRIAYSIGPGFWLDPSRKYLQNTGVCSMYIKS